jgi:DNA-binding transcriptional LysR family regulator
MPNYWNIDLHLLACLDALISEKSVTRAAEKMGLTQPGMSHALTRLRDKFSDPLLIRTSHGMVPTDRALYIASSLKEAVLQLQTSLSNPVTFEPSKSENTFKIAISDYVSFLLLPSLMNLISREAPGVKIEVIPSDSSSNSHLVFQGNKI